MEREKKNEAIEGLQLAMIQCSFVENLHHQNDCNNAPIVGPSTQLEEAPLKLYKLS